MKTTYMSLSPRYPPQVLRVPDTHPRLLYVSMHSSTINILPLVNSKYNISHQNLIQLF